MTLNRILLYSQISLSWAPQTEGKWVICQPSALLLFSTLYRRGTILNEIRSADCCILRSSSYRAVNTFHLGYKNQSVYDISDTSRCLFPDKHNTYKYSVGRTYSCWMLNCWCVTWPVGFKRLKTAARNDTLRTRLLCEKLIGMWPVYYRVLWSSILWRMQG